MSDQQFTVTWIDRGCEPQCPPDPAFPEGKRLRAPEGERACPRRVAVPGEALRVLRGGVPHVRLSGDRHHGGAAG